MRTQGLSRHAPPVLLAAAVISACMASLLVSSAPIPVPRAMICAPVSVAMSITLLAPTFSCAYHSASPSVRRPSASVLPI